MLGVWQTEGWSGPASEQGWQHLSGSGSAAAWGADPPSCSCAGGAFRSGSAGDHFCRGGPSDCPSPCGLGGDGRCWCGVGRCRPPKAAETPTLAMRVATVSSMLATAKAGGEYALAQQLDSHLAVLREQQQAERPFAARLQSAVDRAATKQAALAQASQRTEELRQQLAEAEKQCTAAQSAAEEADTALAALRAQLAQPVEPVATLEGLLTACRSLAGALPSGRLGALEAALAGLHTEGKPPLALPSESVSEPETVPCEETSPAHKRSRSASVSAARGVPLAGTEAMASSASGANAGGEAAMDVSGAAECPSLLVVS